MTDSDRRPAGRGVAQQHLLARIEAGRPARRRRALLTLLGVASSLVLVLSGCSWLLTGWVTSQVRRLDAGTTAAPVSGPLNILVAGVDQRAGLTRRQQLRLHVGRAVSDNSDTLMVVHIPASHQYVQVVSLPRDSWVNIPGRGMNKINAAYGLGGPRLMVSTVAAATGLTINDYVEVNFLGFVKIINALGGVSICLPYAVDDSDSGLHLSAGRHHVSGITALEFSRDRHSFAASDLARITDQQQLMSTLLRQAVSADTLSNPLKLQHVLAALTAAIQVDQGFDLTGLASELRGIRPSDVVFSTVPLSNLNYATPTGQLAVTWNTVKADHLFARMADDDPPAIITRHTRHHKPRHHHQHRRKAKSTGASAARVPTPGSERTAAQDYCR